MAIKRIMPRKSRGIAQMWHLSEQGRLRTENNERRGGKTNFCQPKDFPTEEHLSAK